MSPLQLLGACAAQHRRTILLVGAVVMVLFAVVGAGAPNALVLSRWEAPGSESVQVQDVLARDFGTGKANFILLVTAQRGSVDDPAVAEAAAAVAADLRRDQLVADVWSYWSRSGDPTMRSRDGDQAVILAHLTGDATTVRGAIHDRLLSTFTRGEATISVRVAGSEPISTQVSELATADFLRAELLILPLILILLVVLFRRVRLALLTLGVGLFSVFGTLASLRGLAAVTEVSTFAANITLVMGIGLGVDYSLFVIARFREELLAGATTADAVASTVRAAGRTVVFSGLTVAASLSVMLVFPFPFLRSFAYAGVIVVLMAVIGAVVLLPAALAVLGRRALRRGTPARSVADESGFWYRFGAQVMRRPLPFMLAGLLVVALLAAPVAGLRIGLPDDRVLPPTASTRQVYDDLRAGFAEEAHDAIHIVSTTGTGASHDAVAAYAARLSTVAGIAQVNSGAGIFAAGVRVRDTADPRRYASPSGLRLEVVPTRDVLAGTEVGVLVDHVRAVPAPFADARFGGFPAELTDLRAELLARVPVVAILILLITFVVLLVMSGSLLIPVKATVLNLLSLAVMFGVLVAGFQDGGLAGLLGFTPIGTLDPAFPILMFCVAYGLSMDYEVFMLSRIKERFEVTGDADRAVLEGLQRSAPLVTAAAGVLALSFALYATGQVMYLQMIGIGTAVAIVVDATIIRAVLVPSLMRMAGRANWWAPRVMRPLLARLDPHRVAPVAAPVRRTPQTSW
ncbi:MMPL family transporter [Pseudonocardia sp. TRM90224]|uniref:MMPL family transporter n=1 Tax=Pseudonocardia sp. TRM90224 TaxID=2812678 RepID=UPI001E580551|nr:MMPL family transporter [Pseudonocardia sp. TRM90224]